MSESTDHLRHMMLTRLRARHFAMLSSIAEVGSIHRAAAMHGLSQPGVSKLLKEIEDALGLPLFERTSRGTVPTVYGLCASKTFRAIITEIEYLAHELDALRAGTSGIIRVGVINFISRKMIAEAINSLWRGNHRFIVHVANGTTDSLLAALHALELDCVIARKSHSRPGLEVHFSAIYQQKPCVIWQAGTRIGNGADEIEPSSIGAMRWILPPRGTPGRTEFDRTLAAAGISEPNTIVESGDLDLIYSLVRSEAGICAILPSDIAAELSEKGGIQYALLRGGFEYPPVGIVELPRVSRDPNVELFCQSMVAIATQRQAESR